MYCRICPDCGAYLDPGEVCDCRDEEKAAPDGANTGGGKTNKPMDIVQIIGGKVNAEMSPGQ